MSTPGFVHLHTHSEFSLLDGAARIGDLIAAAKKFEMPALALTDHGVMYGNITFYSEAKEAGIKPILGCEVYVAPRGRTQRDARLDKEAYHLVLLAQNEKGYKNLIKLVSTAFSEGFYYKPRVDKELLAQYSSDLICLTACLAGEVPAWLLKNDFDKAEKSLAEYCEIFGRDNVYLEVQDHDLAEQKVVNEGIVRLAERTGLKLVATNDIHYTNRADADPHDVLLCIQTQSTLDAPNRMRFGTKEFYLKSAEEMARKLGHFPGAIENTLEIMERCDLKFDFGRSNLPDPGIPVGVDPGDHMRDEAYKGLLQRMGGSIPDRYQQQFDYECKIINDCNFGTYMLIVRDFTDFARRQGIYVGVRGSAAGSLVCYGLGITDVDPIEYGLTFERFLNPERIEMPDVDLDIQDDRREELIQYVCDKYGREHVGQIATFGSLKARAAIRDCGRVLGMDLADVDRVAKMIPTLPVGITIDQALEENPDFQSAYKTRSDTRALVDMARTLEGLNRNVGVHAAGVLISDDPLTDHVPVQSGGKGEFVAQMAKKDIAKVGLLKMDFLGLANLTILANAVANVKRHRGIDVDVLDIPLDDAKTFEMLGRGDTNGVFQLEGSGMRRNVIELKPNSVRELAAIVALYRPGPMAHIPKFVKSKFGQEPITYLHDKLKPILEETYGVICYQDQVLRIAQAIGGFTLGQADVLRKAMSSKNKDVMAKKKEEFIAGAKANGVAERVATKIYEQIEPFAGYAFNKAHAVCYAFVAYRTAYMKANYPAEYYAALLSANMDDKDKLGVYIEDCRRLGIPVLPPDVNASGVEFEVEGDGIRFGMGAVKGCGRGVVEAIVESRQSGGPYKSLFDFCERVHQHSGVNKSTVECLIKVGAFSSIEPNHAMLLEMLPDAVNAAAAKLRETRSGQTGLFGSGSEGLSYAPDMSRYGHVGNFSSDEILAMEKDLAGIYISGHPLDGFREALDKRCSANAHTLAELAHDQECTIGGIISDLQVRITKRGDKMAQVKLEDLYGTIPVTFFPQVYKNCADSLAKDKIVLIKGKASHRERIAQDEEDAVVEVEVRGESVSPLTNGNGKKNNGNGSRAVHIKIDSSTDLKLELLKTVIQNNPGDNRVYFWMCHCGDRQKIATPFKVDPSKGFLSDIERLLGSGVVKVG
jgi:DNA polymerase-3 subunit alpha